MPGTGQKRVISIERPNMVVLLEQCSRMWKSKFRNSRGCVGFLASPVVSGYDITDAKIPIGFPHELGYNRSRRNTFLRYSTPTIYLYDQSRKISDVRLHHCLQTIYITNPHGNSAKFLRPGAAQVTTGGSSTLKHLSFYVKDVSLDQLLRRVALQTTQGPIHPNNSLAP